MAGESPARLLLKLCQLSAGSWEVRLPSEKPTPSSFRVSPERTGPSMIGFLCSFATQQTSSPVAYDFIQNHPLNMSFASNLGPTVSKRGTQETLLVLLASLETNLKRVPSKRYTPTGQLRWSLLAVGRSVRVRLGLSKQNNSRVEPLKWSASTRASSAWLGPTASVWLGI